jgi:formiminotetrahydrofolate cyclodeaminase
LAVSAAVRSCIEAAMTSHQTIGVFCRQLAAKQATPGGGAAAAVGGAVGASAALMAAAYTQRKKDVESGAAEQAQALIRKMDVEYHLNAADLDAIAYANLQKTWKGEMDPAEKAAIEAQALAVPTDLLVTCHAQIQSIHTFLPACNPNITSDAKVGIHLLAGAARAAYQTVLVNAPPDDEKARLKALLQEIRDMEDTLVE